MINSSHPKKSLKKYSQVHVNIPHNIKTNAELVLEQMGLSITDAIRLFLNEVIYMKEIPFPVHYSTNIPNKTTQEAIEDVENGKTHKISMNELEQLWNE